MKLIEKIKRTDPEALLTFYPGIEREMLFNFNAHKLKLAIPLLSVQRFVQQEKDTNNLVQGNGNYENRELFNVENIYMFCRGDFEIFEKEKQVEMDKWLYKNGSLFLAITNPLFHKGNLIQEAKCFLISNNNYLTNYINNVDSKLAIDYFTKVK